MASGNRFNDAVFHSVGVSLYFSEWSMNSQILSLTNALGRLENAENSFRKCGRPQISKTTAQSVKMSSCEGSTTKNRIQKYNEERNHNW